MAFRLFLGCLKKGETIESSLSITDSTEYKELYIK